MTTTERDAGELLRLLDALGGWFGIAGGWGVDALVGRATRDHADLDVLLDATTLDRVVEELRERGFTVTTDWLPVRVELQDDAGRAVDLHPAHLDAEGNSWQAGLENTRFDYPAQVWTWGRIDGLRVRCLTAAKQLELHSGYDARPADRHDLAQLAALHPPAGRVAGGGQG